LIKRENYGKAVSNGIGLQMIQVHEENFHFPPMNDSNVFPQVFLKQILPELQNGDSSSHIVNSCWYRIADENDISRVLAMKWSNPLVLGSLPSVGIVIEVMF
jgi:hypothetical protein